MQLMRLLLQQQSIMFALRIVIIAIGIAARTWTWLGRTLLGIHLLCMVSG